MAESELEFRLSDLKIELLLSPHYLVVPRSSFPETQPVYLRGITTEE
jgi:hypothetical protein